MYFNSVDLFEGPPWCIQLNPSTTTTSTTTTTTAIIADCPADDNREDCGFDGINQIGCEGNPRGCSWCPPKSEGQCSMT